MARPLRICIPGGVYHLTARGNAGGTVFEDDVDRTRFFQIILRVVQRFSWICHAYCLMSNHYHLVVETPLPNLPSGMRQLNGQYAQSYNERHGRYGHLFQSRYRSILVDRDSYLLELCRYVVLNPVRAGLCTDPAGWLWSSYRATAGLDAAPPFLATDWLLSEFSSTRYTALDGYRTFIAEGLEATLEERVTGERLGETAFLRDSFGFAAPLREIPRVQIEPVATPLAEIFGASGDTPVALAYRRHGYTPRQIADYIGCSYSTVSRRLEREEAQLAT